MPEDRILLRVLHYSQLDRQYTYNGILRSFRSTTVVVEVQWVLHNLSVCICSLIYPACNAHAPYCHLWPEPLYNIFPHYLINGTITETKSYKTQNMFFYCL